MQIKNITFIKVIKYISLFYILSLSIHLWSINWNINSIKLSEIVFIILLVLCFIGFIYNKIKITFIKSDLFFLLFVIINLVLVLINNFDNNSLSGLIVSIYLFLIYFIYRNIFAYVDIEFYLKGIVFLSIISGSMAIIGWFLYHFGINNIFVIEMSYPFSIGKSARAVALLGTPSLLALTLIIGLIVFLDLKRKKTNYFYLKFIILNFALLLTFSKSVVLYLICLLLIFYKKIKFSQLKYLCISFIVLLVCFHSFFISFLPLNKNKNYEWAKQITPLEHTDVVYENKNLLLYVTKYTILKIKSFDIIKDNYLLGIGYKNFEKEKIIEYPYLDGIMPHSAYLGILSEFGIFGLISIILILLHTLRSSLNSYVYLNTNMFVIIIYLILEGFHMDIIMLKLIWIIFALIIYLKNYKNSFSEDT